MAILLPIKGKVRQRGRRGQVLAKDNMVIATALISRRIPVTAAGNQTDSKEQDSQKKVCRFFHIDTHLLYFSSELRAFLTCRTQRRKGTKKT